MSINRNWDILKEYKNGRTMEQLASSLKVTRARIQQIIIRELEKDILRSLGFDKNSLSKEEKKMLKLAVRGETEEIYKQRIKSNFWSEQKIIEEKVREKAIIKNIDKFITINECARELDISVSKLEKYFPKIVDTIRQNKKKRWSMRFKSCIVCGTDIIPHLRKGYCEKCYYKTDEFKKIVRNSYLKHREERSKRMKEYQAEYHDRPEVKEKTRRRNDNKNYSGNRYAAIARDGFRCIKCGITQDNSMKEYNRDLYVEHIEKNNNELQNLVTLCYECHKKWIQKRSHS